MELYYYHAFVKDVYDGDSVTLDIDLGFNTLLKDQKVRLYGINAPEIKGYTRPEGIISRDWLRNKILHKNIIIRTRRSKKYMFDLKLSKNHKKGKFGRWVASIFIGSDIASVNEESVRLGFAVERIY